MSGGPNVTQVSAYAEDDFSSGNRLYFRFQSMFSVEVAGGYENRISDRLGLSIGLEGGAHFFDTFGDALLHVGPQLSLALYSHKVNSPHQFFLSPTIGVIYGHLKGHKQVIDRYSVSPHLIVGRIYLVGGYRYSFSVPITMDIGLGVDAISLAFPLNQSSPFVFFWPLPFIYLGLGYRL